MTTKKTILLLTDFTKIAGRAADLALELAVNNHADLLIYNSIISIESSLASEERRYGGDEIERKTKKSITKLNLLAEKLRSKLSAEQQQVVNISVKEGTGSPAETILNLVTETHIWIVVMGNHADISMTNRYFDSNVPTIMNNCGCPLLLVP